MARFLGISYYNGRVKNIIKNYGKEHGYNIEDILKKNNKIKQNYCLNCGKPLGKGIKKKFCNNKCSAHYNNLLRGPKTYEQKQNISKGIRKSLQSQNFKPHNRYTKDRPNDSEIKLISEWINEGIIINENNNIIRDKFISLNKIQPRICKVCGRKFKVFINDNGNISKSQTCSLNCRKELQSSNSKKIAAKLISEGKHQGWKSRNIKSYPEKFFEQVLNNNNIKYERENRKNGKYFLDFYITKNGKEIDLEIDGKQHTYSDRVISDIKRDCFLTNKGYIVYRIPWNSINTTANKQLMERKIKDFLEFYNNL